MSCLWCLFRFVVKSLIMECLPRHEHVSQESTLISLWCNDVDRKDFVDIEIYTYYEGLPNLTLRLDTPPPALFGKESKYCCNSIQFNSLKPLYGTWGAIYNMYKYIQYKWYTWVVTDYGGHIFSYILDIKMHKLVRTLYVKMSRGRNYRITKGGLIFCVQL